jgi:ankyrin repeat protein
MPDEKGKPWLAKLFWIAACGNVLLVLIPGLREWTHPRGEFSGLVIILGFAIVVCLVAVIAIVAAIRKPMAYGIGLALVSLPAVWFVVISANDLAQRVAAPSIADQEAGRGYFSTPADRALADAIVAGDVAKVASLAPGANLNAEGWGHMTFMRLALENGHANHDVVAILLRNGIDPDQDASLLYQMIYNQKDEALLRVVIDSGVDLSKHMGRGSWFYFVGYNWPEGLALVLDHGADTEAQDTVGYTEIMRATRAQSWPTVESLLAHGARIDHVGNDGRSLRNLLPEAIAGYRGEIPPRIAELQKSLR